MNDPYGLRILFSRLRVAAGNNSTEIGQGTYDQGFWSHPEVQELARHLGAWYPEVDGSGPNGRCG